MKLGKVLGVLATCVLLATCLLATVDTHLFVYPSLSRYLFLELGVIALTSIAMFVLVTGKGGIVINKIDIFVVLWMGYVIFYDLIVQPCEHYRVYYLCVTLLVVPVLGYLLRARLLTMTDVENILLVAAVIHLLYILGQLTGIVESGNKYFQLTGCNENPTVAALFLVGCIPMLIARLARRNRRMLYAVVLLCAVSGIILLRCRTAYIGLAIEVVILLMVRYRNSLQQIVRQKFYAGLAVVAAIVMVAAIGHKLYDMKKDSADGRLLIWKLSAAMVAERPMGYGYGLFEKNYNLRQADYFANSESTATERRNADFVMMAYNDYLEQAVEGGIPGMLFLIAFYAVIILIAIRQRQWEATAVMSAFAVMSLFNFVYTSVLPWMLVLCYAAFVVSKAETLPLRTQSVCFATLFMSFPVIVLSWGVIRTTIAQLQLKKFDEFYRNGSSVDDKRYAAIEDAIGTSEAFWTCRARNSMRAGRYADALEYIGHARQYSSSPNLLAAAYKCLIHTGQSDVAISQLDTLSHMIPQKTSVRKFLLRQGYTRHKMDKR
ncbi:MAG: O-antigen ligase family protein [Prevotella sp.]|nr:O-antigen ligase family protein [Prevotella sp.]